MNDENEVRKIALEFFKDKFQSLYDKQKELVNLIQGNAILDLNHYEANSKRIEVLEKRKNYHNLAIKFGAFEMVNQARHIEIEEEILNLKGMLKDERKR